MESETWIELEGHWVNIYYHRYAWYVWLQGTGDIGYSFYNRDAAIQNAREYLHRNGMLD